VKFAKKRTDKDTGAIGMKSHGPNTFGNLTRIHRADVTYQGVKAGQGSQILRVPAGSVIQNLILEGGASHLSSFACLRGAVLKFNPRRDCPVNINTNRLSVPPGHTLMDYPSYKFTVNRHNQGKDIPRQVIITRKMKLYLVNASYCHPDQLFIPQGSYTRAAFVSGNLRGMSHGEMRGTTLCLFEHSLPTPGESYNILESFPSAPQTILVQLKEGGHIVLT
jgi:hypothetical protein